VLTTSQTYARIAKDLPKALATTASETVTKREAKYYLDHISSVKTIDAFVNNSRLFSFAMKAFGMEDMAYAKGLVRKALVEGVDNSKSLANRLADPRLRDFVTAFNFQRRGEYTTGFQETQQGTVDRYVRQALEENAGKDNEGVRLALYFERKAPEIKDAFSILADKALLKVVQTALGIPAESATQNIDKQAALIDKKLPPGSLEDPKKLTAFLQKFTSRWDATNTSSQSALPALLVQSASGVSATTLAAIQNLKLGGR